MSDILDTFIDESSEQRRCVGGDQPPLIRMSLRYSLGKVPRQRRRTVSSICDTANRQNAWLLSAELTLPWLLIRSDKRLNPMASLPETGARLSASVLESPVELSFSQKLSGATNLLIGAGASLHLLSLTLLVPPDAYPRRPFFGIYLLFQNTQSDLFLPASCLRPLRPRLRRSPTLLGSSDPVRQCDG